MTPSGESDEEFRWECWSEFILPHRRLQGEEETLKGLREGADLCTIRRLGTAEEGSPSKGAAAGGAQQRAQSVLVRKPLPDDPRPPEVQ